MGQINTNNYPTVDSLADADLLIVENAIHGTGTTTPKQLRENAIGTDPLQTTAQTVTGAINEIFEMATDTVVGLELGKMTSFSDGTIVTDIDLHRAPVAGDRILFYHGSAVASPSNLTTYNDGVAVTTAISDFSMTHPAGLTLMKCVALGENLRWQTVQDIADGGYTAGIGISINGTTINNSAPQLGDDIAYSKVDTVTSGALGYFNADAECLVMDFRTDAEPYNGGYTLRLTTTGASFKYAVLKDKAGNSYAEEIPAGSLVMCKSNVSGTGSEADPVVVTVLEIGNTEMAHDVEVLKDICITEKTATGNPVTVTDALPYNAVSLSAEIEAEQDLHGYDHPWVGGAGKNKLVLNLTNIKGWNTNGTWNGNVYTQSNTIIEVLVDSSNNITGFKVNTNGTVSSTFVFWLISTSTDIYANNNYILSGCPSGGSSNTYALRVYRNGNTYAEDIGSGANVSGATGLQFGLVFFSGATLSNKTFYPMIRLSTESDATYAPYSNICPISGRTSVTITDYDSESNTATVTIQLGQTVYGGTLNVTTGVLTIDKAIIDMGDLTYSYNATDKIFYATLGGVGDRLNAISTVFVVASTTTGALLDDGEFMFRTDLDRVYLKCLAYDDATQFKTAMTGQKICYKLATPTTIQLTPTQLQMLKGYNRLSCDGGGDITLTYKADRLAALEAALAEIGA